MADTKKTVAAVAPDGTPIEVPIAEASALQHSGGHVMSTAEEATARREIDLRDKLGGVEGYVMPGLVGAARGLTFGLSDHALASSPLLRSRLADYEQFDHPAIATGEVAGMVGGALLGAGAPLLAERAGVAAERAGFGAIGRGSVEGAMFGAGDAISESALQDHGLTGEALIGGAAHGALGGAIASGAMGAIGKSFGSMRTSAEGFEGLAAKTFGEAAPGVGRELADAEAGLVSPYRAAGKRSLADVAAQGYIDNLPGSTLSQQAQHGEAWASRERVFAKHAETVETASRDVSTALDEALQAGRKTDMASFGEAKVNQISKLVDQGQFGAQAHAAIAWTTEADAVVSALAKDGTASLGPTSVKKWGAWMGKVDEAIQSGKSVDLHTALDHLKRFVGHEAQFGKGPFGLSTAAKEFDALYQGERGVGGLKQLLEDDVWGSKAARAQRDVNAATANMLGEGKRFTRKFTTEFGSEAGRPLYAADTAAVSGFMGKLTSAANDLDAKSFESWVQARRHFLDATSRNYTFDAATTSAVAKERAALDKLDNTYRGTTKDVTLANQVRTALNEERERGMGGAIGAVFDIASKPYTTLQRLAQIEAQTKGVIGRIAGGAQDLAGGSGKAAATNTNAGGSGKFFSNLLDGLGSARTAVAAAGALGSRTLFEKRAEQIGVLHGNPLLVTDRVAKSLSPIESAAPNVVQQATGVALRGLDFLAGKLPPSRQDPYSIQPQFQPKTRASDAEISRFMRYAQAVDDPLIVLREAKTGTLTRDHVEAIQAVYPNLYDEIRGSVMKSLVDSKSPLPYARRIQLGILLDLPTDKTLSPEFQKAIQATYRADQAGAESPPPTSAVSPDVAGSMQTATQMAVEHAA